MYTLRGKVIYGARRGKKLGFPTANIRLHKNIPQGIYVSRVKLGEHRFNSATFIGNATTFGSKEKLVETHILSFGKNIYNTWITVTLIKKIRDSEKFKSSQDLIDQIGKDIVKVEKY